MSDAAAAAEKKRKRLEAWRNRQKAAAPKPVKLSLRFQGSSKRSNPQNKIKPEAAIPPTNPFGDVDDDEDEEGGDDDDHTFEGGSKSRRRPLDDLNDLTSAFSEQSGRKRRRKSKWDSGPATAPGVSDALDKFMEKLETGAMGSVTTQKEDASLKIDVSGSMMRLPSEQKDVTTPISGGVVTAEQLAALNKSSSSSKAKKDKGDALYTPSDWESEATSASETEDEDEEQAKRSFIEALKSAPVPGTQNQSVSSQTLPNQPAQLAAEVKTEKQRRELHLQMLEKEAEAARQSAEAASAPEFGRLFNDVEGGVMEEAERYLGAAKAAPDALEVLAELNKKKELKAVDHSKVDYIKFRKNLYIVPRALANLSSDEVTNRRAKLKIRVRGQGAPAPVTSFDQCGLSERIIKIMEKHEITTPFPIQAQCIPCAMAGRDTIGIAKTGSGKTLAYLLPLLRHIGDQPPLGPLESGPIGLILAPARELAAQIHSVCRMFCKHLGLKSTAVYGGAAVAEQIGDLKRGVHIAVATPGRLIDILTMQSGKLLSLQRVSFVILDEADRMFDMGFSPQISAILTAVRPDRQTLLFSATFPKAVEQLARKSLIYPIEVIVGGRSVASDNVTQYAEVVEEEDKFLRLLQLLGEHAEEGKKVIIFVGTQAMADSIFEQLLRCGYVSLSLHGGKDQEDRDSTISDFKRKDGPGILVATGVAGRGLDVPSCGCVVNFSAPNHLEAYVHQVGRTGRGKARGVAYTFVNSTDEALYAPIVTRALTESGQAENVSSELKNLSDSFKEKVKRGEAKFAGSGFKGKGYTYDSTELSEAQKLVRLEKRQALIEAGLIDPDEEDPLLELSKSKEQKSADQDSNISKQTKMAQEASDDKIVVPDKLTPELLALPGMKQAILRKAGIIQEKVAEEVSLGQIVEMGQQHYVTEMEINDYPREARWKVTQKDTTSRLQDEFRTAVTLKGEYFAPGREPGKGERRLYLHLEATSEMVLKKTMQEIQRLLNEETLRVGARGGGGHKYNVLG